MSAVEETKSKAPTTPAASRRESASLLTRGLDLLSSVRFGVSLLILLVVASMIGMLIMQQEVAGFAEYYAELTPSQKLIYGSLGFFNIYHSWYFNVLLLVLSINITLASVDRFPKAWTFVSRPKLDASPTYLSGQPQHDSLVIDGESRSAAAERVAAACRKVGLKPTITEKNNRLCVFAERGAWNRLGAYGVHVALLTIFLGGFLTAQFSRVGQIRLTPGESASRMTELVFTLDQVSNASVPLPFTVICTDIQQKLIQKDGTILNNNTLDWLTRIKIKDEHGEHEALVHLNHPYDYRGYRFFQASFDDTGSARTISLRLKPQTGGAAQEVQIQRNGSTMLPDGTRLDFVNFFPDFRIIGGRPDTASKEYNNPAAQLKVTTSTGQQLSAYAFASELPDNAPVGAPVGGYKFRMMDFEKAPLAHELSVKYDPWHGSQVFYLGGALLILTLCSVFFFSHERVWALIEERAGGSYEVLLGANTNRNLQALETRFQRLTNAVATDNSPSLHEARTL
ncbi:MAG: cytochrome c biogenesis protein ResB [Pyrinomonadaceae bacterium]|nr:cytochrome c biogenesis protein ResB [Pyrinomonadaceae bacterium]